MLMASTLLSSQVHGLQFFLIVLSTWSTLPNAHSARAALILSTRNELITARAPLNDSSNEGLSRSTVVGIAFGLFCLLALVISFYVVSQRRVAAPRPPTREQQENAMTYGRWEENIAGKGKSARLEHRDHPDSESFYLPPYSPHRDFSHSESTFVQKDAHIYNYALPPPPPPPAVYLPYKRVVDPIS